ncbi:MAG: hypothetical protein B6245_00760 [Desulfobacteraceae bacterium 4572_88]|nr:MAG: hypothetical protein B6245_00760 [Desulfobacteraceae bacterium 4572_88]
MGQNSGRDYTHIPYIAERASSAIFRLVSFIRYFFLVRFQKPLSYEMAFAKKNCPKVRALFCMSQDAV